MTPRLCASCNAPLERKRYDDGTREKPTRFATRKYCDHECMHRARVTEAEQRLGVSGARHCPTCGKQLVRNRFRAHLESMSDFAKRQYCGTECAAAVRRGQPFPNPAPTRKPKAAAKAKRSAWRPRKREFTPLDIPAPPPGADTRTLLKAALKLHPELLTAFAAAEGDGEYVDAFEVWSGSRRAA